MRQNKTIQKISKKILFLGVFSIMFLTPFQLQDAYAEKIPEWVNGIFNWYVQGNLSEDDLIQALQFLIDAGVNRCCTRCKSNRKTCT